MRRFLTDSRFVIEDEYVDFKDEGIFHNFGKITGKYDHNAGMVRFNFLGKLLKVILPTSLTGHMLCYKVKKVY